MPLKYHVFVNIMDKWSICSFGANAPFSIIFAHLEQMLHFAYFKKYSKLYLNFQYCLKIENDVMI